MLHELFQAMRDFIGLEVDDLDLWQMSLRALIIYVSAIMLVKIGEKRFMGKNTAFDMILGIILGSVLSRAITGNAPFFETIGAGAILVALHWLFSVMSFHFDWFGTLVKGSERTLIKDGEILWDNMRKSHISRKDLEMALRNTGSITDPGEVKEAHFERSGDISIIPRQEPKTLKVIEMDVREGVQKVRIELAID
jgi:uncharacterized membrane protein YcaP (DUF421 family)